MHRSDVLIIGAGPTGLVLALWLSKLGVRVRIVDKTSAPGTTSRALAVQARTLELYRQLDLGRRRRAEGPSGGGRQFLGQGRTRGALAADPHRRGPDALRLPRNLPAGRTRTAADRTPRILRHHGGAQHRAGRLSRKPATASPPRCACPTASRKPARPVIWPGATAPVRVVRKTLDTGFPGGTYQQIFYVADVQASGPTFNGELHVDLDEADFLAVFPLAGERSRTPDRHRARRTRRACRNPAIRRRQQPGHRTPEGADRTGELVLDLPRASSGGRSLSHRPRVSVGRRRPCAQPRRAARA